MTKNNFQKLTGDERRELASQVKALRQRTGLTKKETAHQARITRQTLDNIENGVTVPQAEILERIYDTLGVETSDVIFESGTQKWLVMAGTLIEQIPPQHRQQATESALDVLYRAVRDTPKHTATVTPLSPRTASPQEPAAEAALRVENFEAQQEFMQEDP
ncbi:helix-turn-helix transcriptional regulator [Lysinibacter sp. HNR]|uniref:helix-turn-helix transcriptional regulator n=1 Tax=Lysinibacter sp. HNR TaxID=3031408 RepID=UPI002435234D|nr:helix-turn-helix transcriptional regulator [Lysinibacter sp. HNR]WGD36648.1 helix-turn-helix transcriptional regulator [Lysinibacter sp. HNR]